MHACMHAYIHTYIHTYIIVRIHFPGEQSIFRGEQTLDSSTAPSPQSSPLQPLTAAPQRLDLIPKLSLTPLSWRKRRSRGGGGVIDNQQTLTRVCSAGVGANDRRATTKARQLVCRLLQASRVLIRSERSRERESARARESESESVSLSRALSPRGY
jgi:hypothetical protein